MMRSPCDGFGLTKGLVCDRLPTQTRQSQESLVARKLLEKQILFWFSTRCQKRHYL
ncbi:MAG: hypothetical protein V7K21_14785 [Nostoc sp.]|uniref:hypothetical protein n=1 Tax=Nostoc sp. TaxID=1180 RepID=UPI002FFD0844